MTPERKQRFLEVLSKRQNDLTVVLENVFDPHNVSAVMRSCDAVGIQEVFVLNTIEAPHKRWGFRSSSSAYKWLTIHQHTDLKTCVAEIRSRYNRILTTSLTHDAVNLFQLDLTQPVALVFGNEQYGISSEMMAASDGNFVVPQVGMVKSLNISVACAVTVFEAFRQKAQAGHYEQPQLSEGVREQLFNSWSNENTQ